MEIEYAVHFMVRKGLGPEWVPKTIFVNIDDIEPSTREADIRDMVLYEAKAELARKDYREGTYIYKDMERT